MANTLGALILPERMAWTNRWTYTPVMAQATRTIAGGLAIFTQAAVKGRPITLDAREGVSWLTRAQVDAIMAMAAKPGATFALVYQGESHQVRFAHHDPPAVELSPVWPLADQYTGTIKLITV